MNVFDKVQPLVASEDGELFDVSFNTDEVSFEILELSYGEITDLVGAIMEQVHMLWESYQSSTPKARNKDDGI